MVYFRNNNWSSSNDVISLEKIRLYTFSDQVIWFWNQDSKIPLQEWVPMLISFPYCMRLVLLSPISEMVKKIGMWKSEVEQLFQDFKTGLADKGGHSVSLWPSCEKAIWLRIRYRRGYLIKNITVSFTWRFCNQERIKVTIGALTRSAALCAWGQPDSRRTINTVALCSWGFPLGSVIHVTCFIFQEHAEFHRIFYQSKR